MYLILIIPGFRIIHQRISSGDNTAQCERSFTVMLQYSEMKVLEFEIPIQLRSISQSSSVMTGGNQVAANAVHLYKFLMRSRLLDAYCH